MSTLDGTPRTGVRMGRRVLVCCVVFSLLSVPAPLVAGILVEGAAFHDAFSITSGGPEQEGGYTDDGGALFLYVRNTGQSAESFDLESFRVNGSLLADLPNFKWARSWPETVAPGGVSTITLKGIGAPLAEGQNVNVGVYTNSGNTGSITETLHTPSLRIGHVVPGQDYRTLSIFLRNLDSASSYDINQIVVNDDVTASSTFVGNNVAEATGIKIVKVRYDEPLNPLDPLAIRVSGTRVADQQPTEVGSFLRVTEPIFPTGSYGGRVWENDDAPVEARQLFAPQLYTPGHGEDLDTVADRYGIRSLPIPFPDDNINNLVRLLDVSNDPGTYGHFVRDEPELSNLDSTFIAEANMRVWQNDPSHPTMVNLAKSKRFQEYLLATDHPMFDHYMQYAPLVYGNIFTTYSIKDAAAYTRALKLNTEPLRSWVFAQGVAGVWNNQPTDWGIEVQFWSHVLYGSKGILFFSSEPFEFDGYPSQQQAVEDITQELRMIRSVLLYGDSIENVTVSDSDLLAASVISEQSMVVGVVNASGTYNRLSGVSMDDLTGQSISFDVPDWIPVDRIQKLTENGLADASADVTGRTVTFSNLDLTTSEPYQVFLIGAEDTTPPDSPAGLNVARVLDAGDHVLSWYEPFDNVGVMGYKVYLDDVEVGDVRTPLYIGSPAPAGSAYRVEAYDAAGNLSGTLFGDLDCDGDVDFDDIDEFVLGLNDPHAYEALFGTSPVTKGDIDGDGDLDFDDIGGFVGLLGMGATNDQKAAVPEPASGLLFVLGLWCVASRNIFRRGMTVSWGPVVS